MYVRSIHRERNFEIARCGQKVVHLDKSIVAFQIKLLLECGKGTTEQLCEPLFCPPLEERIEGGGGGGLREVRESPVSSVLRIFFLISTFLQLLDTGNI